MSTLEHLVDVLKQCVSFFDHVLVLSNVRQLSVALQEEWVFYRLHRQPEGSVSEFLHLEVTVQRNANKCQHQDDFDWFKYDVSLMIVKTIKCEICIFAYHCSHYFECESFYLTNSNCYTQLNNSKLLSGIFCKMEKTHKQHPGVTPVKESFGWRVTLIRRSQ